MKPFFTTSQMAQMLGVAHFQLDRLAHLRVIEPAIRGRGSGSRHYWTLDNICEARVVLALVAAGHANNTQLRIVREAVEMRHPADDVVIWREPLAYCKRVVDIQPEELEPFAIIVKLAA